MSKAHAAGATASVSRPSVVRPLEIWWTFTQTAIGSAGDERRTWELLRELASNQAPS
ncbi:hypothetical protein [Saccharopolyspora sp. ASAGF58]|uniref:hypothetical protein n=1 Tax=Saccharopolyspora sp. ASAGF58 TaxID=2719023 RepID=UPI001448305F|nr:hypothetical protein [Saccharopolyspora sp. ASAGF58]